MNYCGLQPAVLTVAQVETFVERGYLKVDRLLEPGHVTQLVPLIESRLRQLVSSRQTKQGGGYLMTDPPDVPWASDMYHTRYRRITDDLCGPGRTQAWHRGLGYLPIRFPEPDRATRAWAFESLHVDGNHFHHYVNSAEQALIVLELLTDVEPHGGGTAVIPGSHKMVSRLLRDAGPDGMSCQAIGAAARLQAAGLPVTEITGSAGDVLFMHPHLLHGSSKNLSNQLRLATNHCVSLQEPMCLERLDTTAYSPVEWAIMTA
ncbi:MAG: phytanoyl-CoA dioxygenase family protein, partial [Verrucomicrobia bacterium]|nr:phytanoyl-CoA dioxygenase family protein [Verrucomicrobiota bacterium]